MEGDEPIWVIIHIYMEISQWNTLYNYVKETKMSFFSKTENRDRSCLRGWYKNWGEDIRKGLLEGEYGANIVYIFM
jgi:hypothetical protein